MLVETMVLCLSAQQSIIKARRGTSGDNDALQLEALGTVPAATKTGSGTSGDNAPQPLLEAPGTACHEEDSQRTSTRVAAPS